MWYEMEYYSAVKKNENLSLVTTWMGLGVLVKSQGKTSTVWFHLCMESKNKTKGKQAHTDTEN